MDLGLATPTSLHTVLVQFKAQGSQAILGQPLRGRTLSLRHAFTIQVCSEGTSRELVCSDTSLSSRS